MKWINDKHLKGIDSGNTDIEIMREGDYRQADESLQSTTNDIRPDSVDVVSQVSGFLYLVEATKSNQNHCQSITNMSQKSKHVDVEYRYVQQTVQEKAANALVTAVSSF